MDKGIRADRVAIYVRWSTDDQADGTTLDVQLEGCKHYILSQGWQVNETLIFVDDGYSGGHIKRPALTKLRRWARDGAIDCVVVFKLDRLSRSVIDTVTLVLQEWDGHTYLKSAREPVDTTTAMGKQFFYMLVSFAEWERNVIRERTQSGKLKRAHEGKNPGFKPPYGYAVGATPGSFQVIEVEAFLVRRIFDLYRNGFGCRAIAAKLNAEGLRFRGGRIWSESTLLYLVQNPLYAGELVYGRVSRVQQADGTRRAVRNDQALRVAAHAITPIISPETFAQVAALRQGRVTGKTPNRARNSPHLLTGLLRCQRCGYAVIARKQGAKVDQVDYYVCSGAKDKGKAVCDSHYMRQDILDGWVVQQLLARYGGELGQERLRGDLGAAMTDHLSALQMQHATLTRSLAEVAAQRKVLARDYLREKITAEDYNLLQADLRAEHNRLTAESEDLEQQLHRTRAQRAHAELVQQVVLTGLSQWETLELPQRKHLLRQLVATFTVYKPARGSELRYDLVWVGRSAR